jgi:hypothetical protein
LIPSFNAGIFLLTNSFIICTFLCMKTGNSFPIPPYPVRLKLIHFPFLAVFIFLSQFLPAQTTSISGIVNTYHRAVEIVATKACVRVNSTTGLANNDKVMLIQMKGASINTSNSAAFGDTTSLNEAGNYEINTVCNIVGDSVFLVYMIKNQYNVSGKVQLVKIPQYYSANIVDTLKPAPWNNTTGTGGVLAIIAEQDIILNAPVYADSSGFRGGEYRLSDGTCSNFFPSTNYFYDANSLTPQDGSFKGEGVAIVASAQSGGRGAPANGGGGGNNHNNGGAGGANLTAGGNGGGNSSSVGCRTTIQGLGGKALSSHGGSKIFFGGGGGAGHSNFNFPNPKGGGNGGGIVFLQADNLVGNNRKIAANGTVGGASLGDGASGGGAGGTIIMDINNYSGAVTIEANGGQGGTANDGGNVGRCYGAGGGGSGGVIYFTGSTPAVTITVNSGPAGPEIGREASCNPIVPSIAGAAGQVIPGYSYQTSTSIASTSCGILLHVELVYFDAKYEEGITKLTWKVADPESLEYFVIERATSDNRWIAIDQLVALSRGETYNSIDPSPVTNNNFYRLKIVRKDNEVSYSPVEKIYVPSINDRITIYPNPATKKIRVTGDISLSELFLFDLGGNLVWQKKTIGAQNMLEVDLPGLPAGVYVLRVGDSFKKLVIRQ